MLRKWDAVRCHFVHALTRRGPDCAPSSRACCCDDTHTHTAGIASQRNGRVATATFGCAVLPVPQKRLNLFKTILYIVNVCVHMRRSQCRTRTPTLPVVGPGRSRKWWPLRWRRRRRRNVWFDMIKRKTKLSTHKHSTRKYQRRRQGRSNLGVLVPVAAFGQRDRIV